MNRDFKYILHIAECIRRIEEDTAGGAEAFRDSHLIQDAVIRNLQVIAESTKRLSEDLKLRHSKIDWSGIAGFRNFLVHDYLGIDLQIVWKVVVEDLPALKAVVRQLLDNR